MAKLREITRIEASNHLEDVRELFSQLVREDVSSNSVFSADKEAIVRVFADTMECTKTNILVRLTLIDSMYSTQMNRRYYALDELADALFVLSEGKSGNLRKMFLKFVKNPDAEVDLFDYDTYDYDASQALLKRRTNLFSENYGIGKDGNDKGVAISLISKYAYFETDFQFPIYDSIACEMYPIVWHFCGFGKTSRPKLKVKNDTGGINGAATMVTYVKAIKTLIKNFKFDKEPQCYDFLDRFLWFVGKIIRGNLSLVLSREEYETTIKLTKREVVKKKKGKESTFIEYFDIKDVNLSDLQYLENKPLLKKFFEFAKIYTNKI